MTSAGASSDPVGSRLLDLVEVMDRLRSPGGCPWDAEQTHESLLRYLVEETYETVDAIEAGSSDGLREELGDLLLQVVFHARIAAENEGWDVDDVATGIVDKLVRRHPHVFSDVSVADADEVRANWEVLKAAEKGRRSPAEGVPLGQPALSLAGGSGRSFGRGWCDCGQRVGPRLLSSVPRRTWRSALRDRAGCAGARAGP